MTKANANKNTFGASTSKRRDILITTPLRLVHLIKQGGISLNRVEHIVMDEADRLFELGFLDQIDEIFTACTHKPLRRCMFSATMAQGVETLARSVLQDPVRLTIGARNAAATTVDQKLIFVGNESGKLLAFRQMIQSGLKVPMLVFVQSKDRGTQLFHELVYDAINVDVIHSERSKAQRDNVISKFRAGEIWVLICTDLMARGIDFKTVSSVVNFDFPQSTVDYIHRIGRTGRAGRAGHAVTFFTRNDHVLLRSVANVMRQSGCEVADWMLNIKKPSKTQRQNRKKHAPPRQPISTNRKRKEANAAKNKRNKNKKRKGSTKSNKPNQPEGPDGKKGKGTKGSTGKKEGGKRKGEKKKKKKQASAE